MYLRYGATRRHVLTRAAAGTAALALPRAGLARMAMSQTQASYFYPFKLGSAECTVVTDGQLPLGDPSASFTHISKDEINRELTDNFLPTNNAVLEQNALVVNFGDRLVLRWSPFLRFSRTLRGSYRHQNASAEQVEAGVAIHLPLDGFQAVDLSFGLPVAPGGGEGSAYSFGVLLQSGSKRFHGLHAAFAGLDKPGVQFSTGRCCVSLVADIAPTHQGGEPAGERGHGRGVLVLFDTCDRCSIGSRQRCGGLHEQPRELPGGRQRRWRAVLGQSWIGWRPPAPSVWRGLGRRSASFVEPLPHQLGRAGEALRLQLPPQHGAILAAFGNPRLQVREMPIDGAVPEATCSALREARSIGVVAHRSACQLHGTCDGDQRLARGTPALHFIIQSKATRSAVCANLFLRGTARERPGASGRNGANLVGHGRQPPQPAMRAGQPALDGLAQVGQQMPPVGHLAETRSVCGWDRRWRPDCDGAGILGRASRKRFAFRRGRVRPPRSPAVAAASRPAWPRCGRAGGRPLDAAPGRRRSCRSCVRGASPSHRRR